MIGVNEAYVSPTIISVQQIEFQAELNSETS